MSKMHTLSFSSLTSASHMSYKKGYLSDTNNTQQNPVKTSLQDQVGSMGIWRGHDLLSNANFYNIYSLTYLEAKQPSNTM